MFTIKSELNLGVLFTGKLDPIFEATIKKIKDALGDLEGTTKKVTDAQNKQKMGTMSLQNTLRSLTTDIKTLIYWQVRWYGARFISMAIIETPIAAAKAVVNYAVEIDKARGEMLRWAATSGSISRDVIQDTEGIIKAIRKVSIEYPVLFEDMSKSAQAFLGAGVKYSTVREMIPMLAQLRTAFKEVDIDQFAVALTGFFKTFKTSMIEGNTEAEKLGKILDSIMKAQAEGIIRPEQFTKVIQYLGNIGHMAGFTVDQILAISVGLTDTGIRAANVSRVFAGMLQSIVSTKAQKTIFDEFGIRIDRNKNLAEQFFKVIEKIREKIGTGQPIKVGWMEALGAITSSERGRVLGVTVTQLERIYEMILKLQGAKGGLSLAADLQRMTLSSQFVIFQNILKELGQTTTDVTSIFKDFIAILIEISKGVLFAIDTTGLYTDKISGLGNAGKSAYLAIQMLKLSLAPLDKIMGALGMSLSTVIDYLIISVNWWLKLFDITNTSAIALADYKNIASTFTLEKARNELSLLTIEFQKLVKEQKELEKENFLSVLLKLTLKAFTFGIWKSKAEELRIEINNILDKMIVNRKKIDELTKPSEKEKKITGQPINLLKEQTYGPVLIASEKAISNAKLAMQKGADDLQLKMLDNLHKLGIIKDGEYYAQREKLLEDFKQAELQIIANDYVIIEKQHDADIKKFRGTAEEKKYIASKEADYYRMLAKVAEVNNKRVAELDNILTEQKLKNIGG